MNALQMITEEVRRLKPGYQIMVSEDVMREVQSGLCVFGYNGAIWTQAEAVLENVPGSAYAIDYSQNWENGDHVFRRLKEPSKTPIRRSPDRR